MATIEKISITLPSDMLAMVQQAVECGGYTSSSAVVREVLRGDAIEEMRRMWSEGEAGRAPLDLEATKKRALRLAAKRGAGKAAARILRSSCRARARDRGEFREQ